MSKRYFPEGGPSNLGPARHATKRAPQQGYPVATPALDAIEEGAVRDDYTRKRQRDFQARQKTYGFGAEWGAGAGSGSKLT